jgi:hypothetical protein
MIPDPELGPLECALRPVAYLMAADDLESCGSPVILEDHRNAASVESLHFAPGFLVGMPGLIESRSGIGHVDRDTGRPEIRLAIGADVRKLRMIILDGKQGVTARDCGGREPIRDAGAIVRDDGVTPLRVE